MEIIKKIMVIAVAHVALAACSSIPAAGEADHAEPPSAVTVPAATQVGGEAAGLGTIAYDESTRAAPCEKVRRTGSHQYITKCDDPDSGSQPVRYGTWNELGRLVMSGSVRPEN